MVTNDRYLEFTASGAKEATGVASVASVLGIARERVLAFGDGNNDIPLLGWAGPGVAIPHGRLGACRAAGLIGPEGDPESALARAVDSVVQCSMSGQAICSPAAPHARSQARLGRSRRSRLGQRAGDNRHRSAERVLLTSRAKVVRRIRAFWWRACTTW
jgi:hypothetical protein